MSATPFRGGVVIALAVLAGSSLLVTIGSLVFGEDPIDVDSVLADSYSESALGHAAFIELLRELGTPVTVSRTEAATDDPGSALLVVAEPRATGDEARQTRLAALLRRAEASLLVLPKWEGRDDPRHPGWVDEVHPVAVETIDELIDAAGLGARLVRLADPTRWTTPEGHVIDLPQPQLLVGAHLEPWIATEQGVLVGSLRTDDARKPMQHVVISDPDLLNNHGLGRGDHATVTWETVSRLTGGKRAVLVDETLHGHATTPSPWVALLRFPLVLALGQGLVAVVVLLWAGMGRFGSPTATPTALSPGKRTLIDNTAELLLGRGHGSRMADRYLRRSVTAVQERLHLPADAGLDQLVHIANERGLRDDPRALAGAVKSAGGDGPALLGAARRIHQWREEMLHGLARRPRGR